MKTGQSLNSKLLLVVLFCLAILLLFFNLAIDKYSQKEETLFVNELSAATIDSVFNSILSEYSISREQIKKIKPPYKKCDSLAAAYSISIPKDLPVPVLLHEVFNKLNKENTRFNSIEKAINNYSVLEISAAGNLKLYAEFKTDKNLLRENGKLSFALTGVENLNKDELQTLIDFPEFLSLVILPSQKNKDLSAQINTNKKEAILLIDDSIEDSEFKFVKDYSRRRLKISVRLTIGAFQQSKFILIDDQSQIYNSPAFSFLEKEFDVRGGYNLIPLSVFERLDSDTEEKVVEQFRIGTKNLSKTDTRLFLCNMKNFYALLEELRRLQKSGVKIIPLSVALNEYNK